MPYCGANPIADMWAEKALTLLAGVVPHAPCAHGDDVAAREQMALAATFAGHGLRQRRRAHPARQRLPDRRAGPRLPPGRLPRRPADGAARHGGVADGAGGVPLHLRRRPGASPAGRGAARVRARTGPTTPRDFLPAVLAELMRDIGIPNGIGAVGYGEADIDDLVEGTLKQQRLLATAPKEVTEDDLAGDPDAVARAVVTARTGADAASRSCGAPGVTDVDDSRWRGRSTPPTPRSTGCAAGGRAAAARRRAARRPRRRARRPGSPLTMRGAGTSIAGNAVGPGIVVDFSRHLNRVLDIDPEARTARRSSPGVVHAALQRAAAPHGPALRPRPVDAHPLHGRRDDRQQRLRVARARLRPHRRQRRGARRRHRCGGAAAHRRAVGPGASG